MGKKMDGLAMLTDLAQLALQTLEVLKGIVHRKRQMVLTTDAKDAADPKDGGSSCEGRRTHPPRRELSHPCISPSVKSV
jgi:hypothetical protein